MNVDSDAIGELLIKYSAFIKYWRKNFKKAYDSVRRDVLYNILMEFGKPKQLIRLIKMCLKHIADSG
jgi:hypothetical protein